ncbi:MAG TPA: 2-hydroxymuconate tautomerase [Paraburkholderia sp.]|jgi:4-oxalocrotonate tautomerase
MPVVHISLVEGRSDEALTACVKAVARAVNETLGAPLETVRVYVTQVPGAHWAVGDKTKDEMAAAITANAHAHANASDAEGRR